MSRKPYYRKWWYRAWNEGEPRHFRGTEKQLLRKIKRTYSKEIRVIYAEEKKKP